MSTTRPPARRASAHQQMWPWPLPTMCRALPSVAGRVRHNVVRDRIELNRHSRVGVSVTSGSWEVAGNRAARPHAALSQRHAPSVSPRIRSLSCRAGAGPARPPRRSPTVAAVVDLLGPRIHTSAACATSDCGLPLAASSRSSGQQRPVFRRIGEQPAISATEASSSRISRGCWLSGSRSATGNGNRAGAVAQRVERSVGIAEGWQQAGVCRIGPGSASAPFPG